MERRFKQDHKLSVTQYFTTETRNQGIGTNETPYITIGGDSVVKNDLSHIQVSTYNEGTHTSLGYQLRRKKIELINQEASGISNDIDESALNQINSTQRNPINNENNSSSVITNRNDVNVSQERVDSARIIMELEDALNPNG